MNTPLILSQYEQDALADLAQHCASVKHEIESTQNYPSAEKMQRFADTVERFERINWGELYDKLHRSGANDEHKLKPGPPTALAQLGMGLVLLSEYADDKTMASEHGEMLNIFQYDDIPLPLPAKIREQLLKLGWSNGGPLGRDDSWDYRLPN